MVGDNQWCNQVFLEKVCSLYPHLSKNGRITYIYKKEKEDIKINVLIELSTFSFDVLYVVNDSKINIEREKTYNLSTSLPSVVHKEVVALVEELENKEFESLFNF
jgi:hypothetical protein